MILYYFKSTCDAATIWQFSLQNPATPIAEGLLSFHNYLMFFLVAIGIFVFYFLYQIIVDFSQKSGSNVPKFIDFSLLELLWTTAPAVLLLFISIPSFALLYSLDDSLHPQLTLKIIGHQWYWTYEYSDYVYFPAERFVFDSYSANEKDLPLGSFRLLEVDNRAVLPTNTHIRLLVTSADVLHSWTVPSLGIKIDACPGRITQGYLYIKRPGVFYGQCSEICGVNHAFMPIVVKAVPTDSFLIWLLANILGK